MVPRSKLKLETVSDGTSITATSVPDIREKRGRLENKYNTLMELLTISLFKLSCHKEIFNEEKLSC
jgi:hypothetical protein